MPTLLNVNKYHYRRGGADVMYLELGAMLRERGWTVADFSMQHPDNLDSEWSEHFVDELEFGEAYSPVVKARLAARVVFSRHAQRRIAEVIERSRPDIAHLHNIYHQLSPSILRTLRKHGVPTVLTTHDLKLACPAYQMLSGGQICERCIGGRIHNVALHRCVKESLGLSAVVFVETAVHRLLRTYGDCVDRFVAPSRFYVDKFVEWGYPRDRFVHIPNYVDVDRFVVGAGARSGVVYFGRLAPEKGLGTLVRAAAASGVRAKIVGAGPSEPELRQLAVDLGAPVDFLGYRSGEELHDLVRTSRASVLPSEWYENAPVSVLESYALGTPVIGARIGGITELVREGETGFCHESGSVDDLARALSRIEEMGSEELAALGRCGRAWVETDFTTERHLEKLFSLYREFGVVL